MKSVILTIMIVLSFPVIATSHPGRTAWDGCHYCRTNCGYWGVPWYSRHCHSRNELDKLQHFLRQEDMNNTLERINIMSQETPKPDHQPKPEQFPQPKPEQFPQ